MIGAGVNGKAAARTFLARGHDVLIWDVDGSRAEAAASELGARLAASREEALVADLLVTMTPGHEHVLDEGALHPGQHVSLMGADGPGKAEIAVAELARTRVFCDDWTQASRQRRETGEASTRSRRGVLGREERHRVRRVLAGDAPGRESNDVITAFDSTGLAIQDLAIALAAMERADELDLPAVDL